MRERKEHQDLIERNKPIKASNNYDSRPNITRKNIKRLYYCCCIFIIISVICMFIASVQTSLALDEYYSVMYTTTIQPQGEQEIQQIVAEVRNISGTSEKLNAIAAWETENFTEIFWEHEENGFYVKMMDPPLGRWRYESTGKIRPMAKPFANDPAWIAYYRFGACGELAHLFAEVANRSGFETRIVVAIQKNPSGNHAWVEINIDDEWWYYDPVIYGEYHQLGTQAYHGRWFRPVEEYDIFSPGRIEGVYYEENMTDIGYRYPKLVLPRTQKELDEVIDTVFTYWHIT